MVDWQCGQVIGQLLVSDGRGYTQDRPGVLTEPIETTHEVLAEATKSVDRLIAVMTAAIASGERVLTAFDQYYPDYVMNDD